MSEPAKVFCPDCNDQVTPEPVDRRNFIKVVTGGAAATLLATGAAPSTALAFPDPPKRPRPAEDLVRELFGTLTDEQKRTVQLAWNHGATGTAQATRLRMFNAPINGNRIGVVYTRPQQELIERILRSISSGDDGFRKLTRGGTYDGSGSLQGCGSHFFGDPTGRQWTWVFSGHHLTVRCDGNSEPNAAFGGPMYYGHSPDGYSNRNVFYYQTRSVLSVFDALTEPQKRQAIVVGNPGEQYESVRFRERMHPGIPASDLTADQKRLVEQVMRDVLSPFRREDADEVMDIVRRNGGLDRIHLAFYRDARAGADTTNWHFWRLEGPGFVWNYRVLPHVHTFVNIAARA